MKYSIIIPVYNTQVYLLEQALESCMQFKDTEVILYNDGSTKVKYSMIPKWENKLKLHYINEVQNVGILQARRTAMQYVTGDYTLFLDSDDEFMKGAYLDIDSVISSYPSCEVYRFINNGCKLGKVDQSTELNAFLKLDDYLPYVTGKVFRSDFIYSVLDYVYDYDNISLGEDTIITLIYLRLLQKYKSNKMYHSNLDIYNIKESHTSKLYPFGYDWNRIKRAYAKMQTFRDAISSLIKSELFNDCSDYIKQLLTFKSMRISTDQFIECREYYRLIDLLHDDFGWDNVIEYFLSRECIKSTLSEYFLKK